MESDNNDDNSSWIDVPVPLDMLNETAFEVRSRRTPVEEFFYLHPQHEDYRLPLRGDPGANPPPPKPTFSRQEIIKYLTMLSQDSDCGIFKHSLMTYICEVVPKLFLPVDEPDQLLIPVLNLEEITHNILEPIQVALLCGKDTEDFTERIKQTDVPNGSCGKIFKSGESTYSCRDCGADPTCVLCNECFNNSEHKHHRYKISSSSGGGYCDCGDIEAWKRDPFCSKHQHNAGMVQSTLLPMEEKLGSWVLETLLHYANAVLSNDYAVSQESIPVIRNCMGVPVENIRHHYSLILYNDEVHTFEIVIHALTKVLKMDKKLAADFTNKIHTEGRAVVRNTTFEVCSKLKDEIVQCTRQTSGKPLRVQIHQSALVAHQRFAEYIIEWITGIMNMSSSYRNVFYKIVSTPMSDSKTFLQTILLNDTKAWKHVRETWHHLLIAGLLKEYDIKKDFATVYANCYGELMAEFSQDDQDHAFSVTSLTVQIFTVPSLAHYLIERDLLFNLMRTIMSEVEPRLKNGKLQYERTAPGFQMRRTQYCLVDLKYLLTSPPKPWTAEMRRAFTDGFSSLVKFCTFLQESDPITRQLGDHMEYEPDWEIAFNTHTRLAPVITLIGEWCASDSAVILKCLRNLLREFGMLEKDAKLQCIVRELANHSATCYDYDVSSLPVSIYLAITRLFTVLYIAAQNSNPGKGGLEKYYRNLSRPSPEYILEAPLRTLTLVAQRYVGMWRRNGYSLLNQLYFYQNVRCRADMFDKDILALQIAATEIESNEFLLHILNKFKILQWADEDFDESVPNEEDNLPFTILLVEEFLLLIINLINGRFLPGVADVTKEDCIRKQIIQFLSIGAMTHSELNRLLEEDIHGETGIEEVVRDVSDLKKTPNGDLYELRPEFYSAYDVFYYHYTREEVSKAEETQRARKIALKEPDVFPPPILPRLRPCFTMLINILQADVLLCIFQTVIKRSLKHRSRSYSDAQLRKVLHLIGYGLNEELETRKADPDNFFQFTAALGRWEIIKLLQSVLLEPRADNHKEMILWIIRAHDQMRPSTAPSMTLSELQLKEADDAELRKQRAAAAKARSMASMSNLQMRFRTVNADLFDAQASSGELFESTEIVETVCLGPDRTVQPAVVEELTCIVCMEKQDPHTTNFVVGCYVQRSTVLAQVPDAMDDGEFKAAFGSPFVVKADLQSNLFIGSCGHVMHMSCWKKHHQNIVTRERRRPFRQLQLFDIEQNESLCPMCECLHNTVMVVLPALEASAVQPKMSPTLVEFEFEKWLTLLDHVTQSVGRSRLGHWMMPVRAELKERELEETFDSFWSPISGTPKSSLASKFQVADTEFFNRISSVSLLPRISSVSEVLTPVVVYHTGILALSNATAFTLTSFELSSREQGIPLFGPEVPSRLQMTLKYLIRNGGALVSNKNLAQLSAAQFLGMRCARIFCHQFQHDPDSVAELGAIDAFTLLVTATYSLPFLFAQSERSVLPKPLQTSTRMDTYIFKTVFFLHMTQILMQKVMMIHIYNSDSEDLELPFSDPEDDTGFYRYCRKLWKSRRGIVHWDDVLKNLEELVVPFVTCCCKFYECYTSIEPTNFLPQGTKLPVMLKYLGQPTDLKEYFTSALLLNTGLKYIQYGVKMPNIYPRSIKPLTSLPFNYLNLINLAADFTCETSRKLGHESRHPTICLVCGKILCSQSACCSQEVDGVELGGCSYHLRQCGSGTGMFLRIRDCKCFLLTSYGTKGTYVPPPYVDEYGETDQGLRRGNPLQLSSEKYEYLRKLWINHGIPEEIVRINERNQSVPSFNYTTWAQF